MIENINWYPGHMKKTGELIKANLKMVDAVIEVIDARIPDSSRNPIIKNLIKNKKRIAVLNKSDLSDAVENKRWAEKFKSEGYDVLIMNCIYGRGVRAMFKLLGELRDENNKRHEFKRPYRIMIVGVPNVGKSSLINRMTGKKSAKVGNKPGVTKGKQWLTLRNNIQLLDTPGILQPKLDDKKTGLNLAFCGSIKDEILDLPDLALEFIKLLSNRYPQLLLDRYKLDRIGCTPIETMEAIAEKRGFILPGREIDYERTGRTVLNEFRDGLIGNITLENANGDD